MLIDLLNSANYIMVNRDAIKILGLKVAVYCAELLNIYKKAFTKNKMINEEYFKVDRKYITEQTSLTKEEQYTCDKKLNEVKILTIDENDLDIVNFNIEEFASLLSSEDVKLLKTVSLAVNKSKLNTEEKKELKRNAIIKRLKENIKCNTYPILLGLRDWIDSIMANPYRYISQQQVDQFKDGLDNYCEGKIETALELINIAITYGYIDCNQAIKVYEGKVTPIAPQQPNINNRPRTTVQKRTKREDLSEQAF